MTAGIKSVQWRILARLLPLLALVFVGLSLWLGSRLTEALRSADSAILRSSNLAVVSAVRSAMVTGEGHDAWDRVVERIPHREGTEIEIVNTRGQVLFPVDGEATHGFGDDRCSVCHADGSSPPILDHAVLRQPGGESQQVLAAPLRNAEECRACHDKDGPKLGMVLARKSLRPIQRQVRTAQLTLAASGGIVLLLTALTTRSLLGRYLNRPLGKVVAGARAIGAGDFRHTIELPESTQLAVLASTLNQSAARLSSLQRELLENERLAAIGQTVAGLSHTLKNVLNGLRAGQFVLDRALEKGDDEKLRKGLRVTQSSVRRVERLIFDMLYYAKERVPARKPIDPNEIIREVVDELKEMADGQGVTLRAEADEKIGTIKLDRTAIYRALVDLVTNAIEACTESESGDLVVLRSRGTPDEIVLTVEDNGIGMSEEVLSNLYTRFFSTKAAGGTGLGMLVVKKITEEHNGTVKVDSVPGKGSAFHIHLPRSIDAGSGAGS